MKIDNYKEDKIEIQAEQQQKKEIKLVGSQRKIPGLTMWEYNLQTKEITPAKYQKVDIELRTLSARHEYTQFKHKIILNEKCVYIQALTKERAIFKLRKRNLL